MVSAQTDKGDTINVGNQTVPLLQSQDFITQKADLSIVKSDSIDEPADAAHRGQSFSYTLIVKNNSTDTVASTVVVKDQLDTNVAYQGPPSTVTRVDVNGNPQGTPYTEQAITAGGVIEWDLGAMEPGEVVTITIPVKVKTTAPQTNIGGDPTPATAHAFTPPTAPSRKSWINGAVSNTNPDLFNYAWVAAQTDDATLANNGSWEPTAVAPPSAAPSMTIVKKTNGTDNNNAPGVYIPTGNAVTWTYDVHNTATWRSTGLISWSPTTMDPRSHLRLSCRTPLANCS